MTTWNSGSSESVGGRELNENEVPWVLRRCLGRSACIGNCFEGGNGLSGFSGIVVFLVFPFFGDGACVDGLALSALNEG